MDLPVETVFGHELAPLIRPQMRRLKCDNKKAVEQYKEKYLAIVKERGLLRKARELYSELPPTTETGQSLCPITQEQIDRFNYLEREKVRGIALAERKCRKLKTGVTSWSPSYASIHHSRRYWKLTKKHLLGKKVSTRQLQRLAKKAGVEYTPGMTPQQAHEQRRMADHAMKKFIPKSEETRDTFIEDLQIELEKAAKIKESNELASRRLREKQRKESRLIKNATNKARSGGISMVIAPNENGERVECRTRSEIETACLKENKRRFYQASNTAFLQPPLLDLVGPLGTGPAAQSILDGTFDPPEGTDPYAVKLIEMLAMPAVIRASPPVDISLNVENFQKGWRRSKEATSAGGTLHFGHFKASVQDEELAEFEAIMSNIPYQTGVPPERWKESTNVMLLKKKDIYDVEKLRTVLLMAADFNHNNKRAGRDMMKNVEKHGTIAREQYGSRKNHASIDHCINKVLTFDLLRQKHQPGGHMATDAVSCYDRIVHGVASLAMQRQGMPLGPIVSMMTTLQNMKHKIRTIFGDSEGSFNAADSLFAVPLGDGKPIQGVGQGNGAAAQIWAVVSSPVLEVLRSEGYKCIFKVAISGEEISFVGYSFVDDADTITSGEKDDNYIKIIERMQGSADIFEGVTSATGGAFSPEKTYWYLIAFKWVHATWKYTTIADTPGILTMKDKDGVRIELKRLEPWEAERTLGVRIAPDGNNQLQFEYMVEQAQEWAALIRSGHLP